VKNTQLAQALPTQKSNANHNLMGGGVIPPVCSRPHDHNNPQFFAFQHAEIEHSIMASSSSRQACLDAAFHEAVKSISKDMTSILHGSGDVSPSDVNAETVHMLSSLTVQYASRLVDAALDSYSMFLNNPETIIVPPPSLLSRKQHRTPAIPQPFERPNQQPAVILQPASSPSSTTGASSGSNASKAAEEFPKRKPPKRRLREEYWDEGLPEPKIRSKAAKTADAEAAATTAASLSRKRGVAMDDENDDKIVDALVPMDEWVGTMGVNLYERSVRKAHLQAFPAINTSHFVFPICHDVYAYGRVRDVQAAKRKLMPILQDATITQVIREEGKRKHRKKTADGKGNNSKSSSARLEDDPDDEDDDDDDEDDADDETTNIAKDLPMWPDMEFILPIHRSLDH
jgi:hypothetical protein